MLLLTKSKGHKSNSLYSGCPIHLQTKSNLHISTCQSQIHNSRTSNIAFLIGWAQMSDLDFGLIRQNISNKKASFQYQGCPLSLKSGKLWLNSYVHWISITSSWFYSQQFSLPYSKNILSVWSFRGDKKKKKKVFVNPTEFFW